MPPATITSRRSPKVGAVRKLHEARGRKAEGLILVEGPDALCAAIASGVPVQQVFVTRTARERFPALLDGAGLAGTTTFEVTDEVMAALAQTLSPQGVVATCAWAPVEVAKSILSGSSSIVLEAIADPGNAGTIIRTADAAGLGGVVLTQGSVDPGNGKCVRASAGSIFNLPISAGVPPEAVLERAKQARQLVVAATADGEHDLFTWLRRRPPDAGTCWILGTEAHGLSALVRDSCEASVRIPMLGRAESLNVATAAAVCLYAAIAAGMED